MHQLDRGLTVVAAIAAPRQPHAGHAAFTQRRKTLRNAVRAIVPLEAFAVAGIDPGRRGETLGVAEFVALADAAAGLPAG